MKKTLPTVSDADPGVDSILVFANNPGFLGDERDFRLLCGGCNAVVGDKVSVETILSNFASAFGGRLLVRCADCGSDNVIAERKLDS